MFKTMIDQRNAKGARRIRRSRLDRATSYAAHQGMEQLEPRQLLTVFTVSTTADTGAGSLRQAITNANNTPGNDTINFNITTAANASGYWKISPATVLPDINGGAGTLRIDGTTQPGYSTSTHKPVIAITRGSAPNSSTGLNITSAGNAIVGVRLNGWATGIAINASNNVVQNTWIGHDGGNGNGIVVNGGSGSLIGGTTAAQRNVISGNFATGITVNANADHTLIEGNYIGTDETGMLPTSSNSTSAIVVHGTFTTIGGATSGMGNLISGNANDGVEITSSSGPTLVAGNWIGLDATGLGELDNVGNGLLIDASSNVTVGGTSAPYRNVFGANNGNAIHVNSSSGVAVQGNYAGLGADGATAFHGTGDVMLVSGASTGVTIGGATGAGNVISGGNGNGIRISSVTGGNITVQGNWIGTDAAGGLSGVGNWGDGVLISATSGIQVIGNVIAANSGNGIHIPDPGNNSSTGDLISQNSIYANGELGIHLGDSGTWVDANTFVYTPTPNHLPAGQTGPNLYQNYPVLGMATRSGGTVTISGTLNAGNNTKYHLEFFGDDPALISAGGFAQGQVFLGSADVDTTPGSIVDFSVTLNVADTNLTHFTATATDPDGNTSEFSLDKAQQVVASLAPTTTTIASTKNPSQLHEAVTFTATVAYNPLAGTPDAPITFLVDGAAVFTVAHPTITSGTATAMFTTSDLPLLDHTITASFGGDAHFAASSASRIQTVDPRITETTLSSSLNPSSYHQNVTFTATVSSAVSMPTGQVNFYDDGGATFLGSSMLSGGVASFTTNGLEVGSHSITVSYLGDANHSVSGSMLTQDVTKAMPVLTWNNPAAITYGTPLSGAQLNASADVTGTFVYTPASGTMLSAGAGQSLSVLFNPTDTAHYLSVSKTVSIDVNRAVLTITPADASRIYGQANPPFTATISGFVNQETLATSGVTGSPALATSATSSSNVGDYAITASAGTLSAGNYSFSFGTGSLHVTQAPLTVTTDDASRVYGAGNPTFTGTLAGVVAGDNITASFSSSAGPLSDVGTYAISPSLNDPDGRLGNYDLTSSNGTLTITKAQLVSTPDDASRMYGSANRALTGALLGLVAGDNITATYSTPATITSNVGNYPIVESLVDPDGRLANYDVVLNDSTLAITPAPLLVTSPSVSKLYGQAISLTGSISGLLNNDNVTAAFSSDGAAASAPVSGSPYAISAALNDPDGKLANYDVSYALGSVTVGRANLTIKFDDKPMVYGSAMPELTTTITGFVNNDTVDSLDSLTVLADATATSGVGTYLIFGDAVDPNYMITLSTGFLTITPAQLTVTAGDASRAYGAVNPTFSFGVAGFVNNDTASVLSGSPSLSTSANPASPVGQYDIVAGAGSLSAANYALDFVNGKLNVTKASLSVSADNASRTYGAANPAFTGAISGILNNDNITASYSTAANALSDVGGYDIVASLSDPGGKLANYDVTLTSGTLTVSKASATLVVDNQSKVFGQANPALTGTLSGILNNDDLAASFSTTATASSDVGNYPITGSVSGTKLGNYDITITNGTLAVNAASTSTSLSASTSSANFGDSITFTANVSSPAGAPSAGTVTFSDGTTSFTATVLNGVATWTTTTLPLGSHAVVATYNGSTNFNASASSSVTVNIVSTPFAALSGSVYYDQNNDGIRESGESGLSNVTLKLVNSAGQVVASTTTNSSGNYTFNNVAPGTYTILEIQPTGYVDGIETAGSLGGDDGGDNNTISSIPVSFGQTGINYNFGELKEISVDCGDTATIGFWNNKNGQSLIKSFNGSSTAKNLGNWLASTFPHIYGVSGTSTCTVNKTNTQVAAIFQTLFSVSGQKLDAQVMAVALACYTTDKDLGGTAGSKYGFDLSAAGTAVKCYNIGSNGAAFDVANNTVISVMDALLAADAHAVNAVLYGGYSSLRNMANTVFNGINNTGDIA